MQLFQSESLKVLFDEKSNRLSLTCQGKVISEQCKPGFLKAMQQAREQQVKSWLLDFRQVEAITEETQAWIQVHIFPQIMAYLGAGNYLALVVSDKMYRLMLSKYGMAGLRSYNCYIIINTFAEPEAAADWLSSKTTQETGQLS